MSPAAADYSDFIISEIMYDPPGSDSDQEWVEIFNNATTSATLVGGSVSGSLRFYDGANHTLATSAAQGSLLIDPQTYFVLAQDANVFKANYPSFNGTLVQVSGLSLGNTAEMIGFRLGSAGNIFSELTYQKAWGGNGTGKTLEKKTLSGPNDGSNWLESPADKGTPGPAYSAPTSITVNYPTTVRLNEFMPDPDSGEEWVEIFNSDSSQAVTLSNWQIDDVEGGSSPQSFSADLSPASYFVVYFGSHKLNNSGDSVRLIRPDGVVFDSFNYSRSTKGVSYAFGAETFVETKTPTPGGANRITPVKEKHKERLAELKKLSLGSEIELEAFVTAPGNLLGDKVFYLSDGDAGIKVSYENEPSFKIEVDDKVALASSIEESYNEKYIKTTSVSLLQKGARHVEERKILTGEAREPFEGMLVKVLGKVVENSGDTFYLDDGSGKAKIYLRDSIGLTKPKMNLGDDFEVMGLLSQYGYLKDGEANYRILPRFQSDLRSKAEATRVLGEVLGVSISTKNLKELPRTGPFDFYTLGWILIFLGLSLRLKSFHV